MFSMYLWAGNAYGSRHIRFATTGVVSGEEEAGDERSGTVQGLFCPNRNSSLDLLRPVTVYWPD